jgi:hypothetical protein
MTQARDEGSQRGALQPDEHVPPIRTRLVPAPGAPPMPRHSPPREPAAERPNPPVQAVQHATKDERQPKRLEAPLAEQRLVIQRERRVDGPPAVMRTTVVERVSGSPSMRPSRTTPEAASRSAVLLAKSQTSAQIRRDRPSPAVPAPVQITIGRVEVHAVAAKSARAPASAPPGPRLSLDEYLRQRNGAAR